MPGKVLKEWRSPRERGRMGTSLTFCRRNFRRRSFSAFTAASAAKTFGDLPQIWPLPHVMRHGFDAGVTVAGTYALFASRASLYFCASVRFPNVVPPGSRSYRDAGCGAGGTGG